MSDLHSINEAINKKAGRKLLPSIAVGIRRMHDVGKSGWFILIPIYNIILAATEGQAGGNEYGEDPKRPDFHNKVDNFGNN